MTVKELETIGIIREIVIEKKRNSHSTGMVTLYIKEVDNLQKLKKQIGREVCIEDDIRLIMRGTIRELSCHNSYSGLEAVIKIVSYSDKIDKVPKKRIFQNIKKKYRNVFEILNSENAIFQMVDNTFSTLEEPLLLLQSNQTDFAFACDIVQNCGYALFVNDTDSKCVIYVGKNVGGAKVEILEEELTLCHIILTENTEKIIIRIQRFLELGRIVRYDRQIYVVIAIMMVYKNGTIQFEYVLEREIEVINEKKYVTFQLGKAKVISTQDLENLGRIQVKFLNYEDCMNENLMWIPYIPCLTEKDKGIVIIPEVEEIVYVFCENGQCYSSGCIRETTLNDKIKDVHNKMILLRDNFISFSKEKVEMEILSYFITIEDNLLTIRNKDNSIKLEKDKLLIQCGDSKINLNREIIQLLTNNKVDVKADKINLDGNSKISAKTSSFDVG